jgi:hypothetical protein
VLIIYIPLRNFKQLQVNNNPSVNTLQDYSDWGCGWGQSALFAEKMPKILKIP